jgi:hypothetical protein
MADRPTSPKQNTDTLGVIFKQNKPKKDADTASPLSDLYGRSLASISTPGKKDVRIFNVESAFDGKSIEEGTIVSDRRKDRPTLAENIASAFSEWTSGARRALGIPKNVPQERTDTTPIKKTESTQKKDVVPVPVLAPSPAVVAPRETEKGIVQLQKIRTFKSDAALLQPTDTQSVSSKNILPSEPKKNEEPKNKINTEKQTVQSAVADIIKNISSEKGETNSTPPSPKNMSSEKNSTTGIDPHLKPPPVSDSHTETPVIVADLRSTMVAPEVHTRLKTTAQAFVPKTKTHTDKPAQPTYAFHVPDVVETHAPLKIEVPKKEPEPQIKKESVGWTHTLPDTAAETSEPYQPITPPLVAPHEEHETPIPMRESTVPILAHESRTIETGVVSEPAHEPVKPTQEQPRVPQAIDTRSTPIPPESLEKPTFHAVPQRSGTEHIVVEPVSVPQAPTREPRIEHLVTRPATRIQNSTLRFAIQLSLILLVIASIAIGGIFIFTSQPETEQRAPSDTFTPVPDIESEEPTPTLTLTILSDTFLSDAHDAVMRAPSGIVEIPIYADTAMRNATAQEFFAAAQVSLFDRAVRMLEPDFVFGSVTTDKNVPFILIRSNNFDSLFAGLLAWEPRMPEELAPLFTITATSERFTDAVQNNNSIRVLVGDDGSEQLLYSFINARTVIITTSAEALSLLLSRY